MALSRTSVISSLCLFALSLVLALPATAQERTASSRDVQAVLELFTSQSCRDCPPAGALAARLGDAPGILVLAYHVDYWDYIGWEDPLAARKNTERQKGYARRLKLGALVTPQIVVNGRKAVDGSDEAAVAQAMAALPLGAGPASGEVRMAAQGDRLHIEASATGGDAGRPAPVLVLVTYSDRVETEVMQGSEVEKTFVDHHPVRDWRLLGTVDRQTMRVEMPLGMLAEPGGERTGLAALLQVVGADNKPGQILAAAALEF